MALVWLLFGIVLPVSSSELPENEDDNALRDEVEYLLANPIDLNRATVEDLLAVPWLNPLLAYRVVAARDSAGGFAAVRELLDVPGMTKEQYELLRSVVTVARKPSPNWAGSALARVVTDSVPPRMRSWASLKRLNVTQGSWRGSAVVEKDRGEIGWADWLGIGIQHTGTRLRVTAGDYSTGLGLGLVFSGPYQRGSTTWLASSGAPSMMRLVGTALENRNLRGLGVELNSGSWRFGGFGSLAARDARLNPDGTVERLMLSGTHDSASSVWRRRIQEASVGVLADRFWQRVRVQVGGCGVRYSRAFVPQDSVHSFCGNALAVGGVGLEACAGAYLVRAEAAGSSGGGYAAAMMLDGNWPSWTADLAVTGYTARFFAPLGRWRALTDRRSRLEGRVGLGFRHAGFRAKLSGNTYRDFVLDSLPAKLELDLGYNPGRFEAKLRLGRSSRLEQGRSRTAQLELDCDLTRTGLRLVLADEYPELVSGRGRMAGLVAKVKLDRFWLVLTAARFDIVGKGVRMYFTEYGPMRVGFGFSTSSSAWRGTLGFGYRVNRRTGIGIRLGYTARQTISLESGVQLEVGFPEGISKD